MKRNLIQLDNEMLEIKRDAKGNLTVKRLTPEELVEVHVLEDSVATLLDNDFNKIANDTMEGLRKEFKASLRENILRVVGFTNNWGKWEVDNCNGRNSLITEYIAQKIRQDIKGEFDSLLKEDIEKMLVPMRKQLAAEYKEVFARTVRESMRYQAQEAAKEFLTSLLTKEITKVQKQAIAKAEACFLAKKKNEDADVDADE
jgi:hypothetical protein